MFRCERSGVFASQGSKFGQGDARLVKNIIAELVLLPEQLACLNTFKRLQIPQITKIQGETFELGD